MSANKSVVDSVQPIADTSNTKVLVVSDDHKRQKTYQGWIGDSFDVDVATLDEVDRLDAFEVVDVVLIDGTEIDVSDKTLPTIIRSNGYDGPVGIISTTELEALTTDKLDTDYVVGPIQPQDVIDLVNRLVRREQYRSLLKRDFVVTHQISSIQRDSSNDADSKYRNIDKLLERKERVQASIREIQRDFDGDDYLAVFKAGFDGLSTVS